MQKKKRKRSDYKERLTECVSPNATLEAVFSVTYSIRIHVVDLLTVIPAMKFTVQVHGKSISLRSCDVNVTILSCCIRKTSRQCFTFLTRHENNTIACCQVH